MLFLNGRGTLMQRGQPFTFALTKKKPTGRPKVLPVDRWRRGAARKTRSDVDRPGSRGAVAAAITRPT